MPPNHDELKRCRAMVVEENALSRSVLVNQLRELGAEQVRDHARPEDARRDFAVLLPDLVFCEQRFHASASTGQDLLDEVRYSRPLSFETSFILVTSQATSEDVAAAAAAWVDSVLIKPYTADDLLGSIRYARQRKQALKETFAALREGRIGLATQLCKERAAQRGEFHLYAAQVALELLLHQGEYEEARTLLASLRAAGRLAWVRLGFVRCQMASGETRAALDRLRGLLVNDPGNAEAHELESRVYQARSQPAEALDSALRSHHLSPGSTLRLQLASGLAFCQGDHELAKQLLDQLLRSHLSSSLFDPRSLMQRALLMFRDRDHHGVLTCLQQLVMLDRKRLVDDLRLRRIKLQLQVLVDAQAGDVLQVAEHIHELGKAMQADACTLEAAAHLTGLLSELAARDMDLFGGDELLMRIGMRFCTSQMATWQLLGFAHGHAPVCTVFAVAQAKVQGILEAGLSHALEGKPGLGVEMMVDAAELHLNERLRDNARLTLQRHRAMVPQHHQLQARIEQLRLRMVHAAAAYPAPQASAPSEGLSVKQRSSGAILSAAAPG